MYNKIYSVNKLKINKHMNKRICTKTIIKIKM